MNTAEITSVTKETVDEAEESKGQDFSFCSLEEYNSFIYRFRINSMELDIEIAEDKQRSHGYRIVDAHYLITNAMKLQINHNKHCTGGCLEYFQEKRNGLISSFVYKCNVCDKEMVLETEPTTSSKRSMLNYVAVWGTLATGSCYAHLEEFLSVLDAPALSKKMFFKHERELSSMWKDSLWEVMKLAGKEEHEIAKTNGDIDADGIPYITVFLDGG
ncbi:hypothetical protein ILUMI_19149 [Ignelater luminosus]|uniref:Mutator-like transposase domain-containing protein n=1 Tax=Ignelater luminosus TaxID=2038154 RepID=A0A8K0G5R0_IGNLU|nr:hypothetical protein ILUMI_19149 [Ignelater luminosus]